MADLFDWRFDTLRIWNKPGRRDHNSQDSNESWFNLGTAGLVVFNAGPGVFRQAVIFLSKM